MGRYGDGQRGRTVRRGHPYGLRSSIRELPVSPVTPSGRRASVSRGRSMRRAPSSNRSSSMSVVRLPALRLRRPPATGRATSGGFFKRAKRMPKRQKTIGWFNKKGTVTTLETGFKTTGVPSCAYIGHGTWTSVGIIRSLFDCIFKKLTLKSGFQYKNVADVSPWITGDQIFLSMKNDQEPGTAETSLHYNFTTGETIAAASAGIYTAWDAAPRTAQFTRARVVGSSRNIDEWIDLSGCVVHWNIKSALKIQNQTLSYSGSNEEEAVDNVPVYGKQYEGHGTGTQNARSWITGNISCQVIDDTNGLYLQNPGSASPFEEPPPAKFFTNVKTCKNVKLDPGQIKTSMLMDSGSQRLETLWKFLQYAGTESKPMIAKGKFRFFALEQMIKAESDAPNIIIFGEHNIRLCVAVTFKYNTYTDEWVRLGNYVTY